LASQKALQNQIKFINTNGKAYGIDRCLILLEEWTGQQPLSPQVLNVEETILVKENRRLVDCTVSLLRGFFDPIATRSRACCVW
jgi:hypothetical protein